MTQSDSDVHSRNLTRWARDKADVLVLSGDLTGSTEIVSFRDAYPDRFLSMGMAEQNMLSWAGGLAREGFVPFLHTFSVFLVRRPYDQLAMSVCYPNLPVKLFGFLPGLTTPGGVSHQAIEDIALMRALPNMTVLEVGDAADVESVLDVAYDVPGPVYIRMLRGSIPRHFDTPMHLNTSRELSSGEDLTVVSSGLATTECIAAVHQLQQAGVSVRHVHVSTLKPFNDPTIDDAIRSARSAVVTVENHSTIGGLGSCVAERMAEIGGAAPLLRIGIPDTFAHGATTAYLFRKYGLDAASVASRIATLLGVNIEQPLKNAVIPGPSDRIAAEQLEAL